MFGNNGSRIASWLISFMPTSRWHGIKRFLLRRLGGIEIGERTTIFSGAKFVGRSIKIGRDCHIGSGCEIRAQTPKAWITIGDWCSLGPEVYMTTGGHNPMLREDHRKNGIHLPITIGNHVGLSIRDMVMPGVTMGDYSQAMPGVVVSTNVPERTIVASAPLRTVVLPGYFRAVDENRPLH